MPTTAAPANTPTINVDGGVINMVQTDPTPATPTIITGGGAINLQGGIIQDTSVNQAISLDTGVALISGSNTLSIKTHCSVDAVSGLTQDPNCTQGLSVSGDQGVGGRLTANSLYAQTFIYQSSDMRLKKNIHSMGNSLDDVMKLNPVDFTFKSSGQESFGVIAQDIEKVYPQLVTMRGDGMKAVNYEGLIAPLIGAVQELKKENDDLRQQLRAQSIREDKLEQELKSKP